MENITIEDLMNKVEEFEDFEKEKIKKAYYYAKELHKGQYRQSGEEYIIHPLNVAYILAEMKADTNTICAGLLHDTIEDTNITKEEIAQEFSSEVANLVDGVTKFPKIYFSSKKEEELANTRKNITGLTIDVRILLIKLADRLHNMRTLEYKSEFKQKENSLETLEIYAPLAEKIGMYQIKNELEDLSLRYLKPNSYQQIKEMKEKLEENNKDSLKEMSDHIHKVLVTGDIKNEINILSKNIYRIYKRLEAGDKLSDIHNLFALKVLVEKMRDCYLALGYIHQQYHPVNGYFKDYICNPKPNGYQSLHTTLFGNDGNLVQAQIRTYNMDRNATNGISAYWDIYKEKAKINMQEDLKKDPFFQSIVQIDDTFQDNDEFLKQVKQEVLSGKIYVYTTQGEIIELPVGATPIDFAYKLRSDIGNTMVQAVVNDEYVPVDSKLHNKDRVKIITDDLSYGPREDWIEKAKTTNAKKKIKDFIAK